MAIMAAATTPVKSLPTLSKKLQEDDDDDNHIRIYGEKESLEMMMTVLVSNGD